MIEEIVIGQSRMRITIQIRNPTYKDVLDETSKRKL